MKQLLQTLLMAIFAVTASAQITINRADFPLSTTGPDSVTSKLVRRAGLVLPAEGANRTWDYTALRDSIAPIYYYGYITRPVTIANPAFPTANLEADHFTFFQSLAVPTRSYYRLDATGYNRLGSATLESGISLAQTTGGLRDSLVVLGGARPFTPVEEKYRFPITMSSKWGSQSRVVAPFKLNVAAFGLNNTPGENVQYGGTRDSVVGWGTLQLRHPSTGATLSFGALLVKSLYITQDSFYLGGAPAPTTILNAFQLVQGRRDTFATYYFIGANSKSALLNMETNPNFTTIGRTFRSIAPNLGLVLSNGEVPNLTVQTRVFPNPTTDAAQWEFEKTSAADWAIVVFDAAGRVLTQERVSGAVGKISHQIQFDTQVANGTYFYQLLDENSLIRNSGKINLMR